MSKTYSREGVRNLCVTPPPAETPTVKKHEKYSPSVSPQLRGFFKGMAFPLLTTGLINSVTFGCYSNALDYLTQSQRDGLANNEAASAAQVFAAGCFSGLIQVRLQRKRFSVRFSHCCNMAYRSTGVQIGRPKKIFSELLIYLACLARLFSILDFYIIARILRRTGKNAELNSRTLWSVNDSHLVV